MKNKDFLIKTFILTVIWIGMLWQELVFILTPGHQLNELIREVVLMVFLAWVVSVLFEQNRDDDDWVGQY